MTHAWLNDAQQTVLDYYTMHSLRNQIEIIHFDRIMIEITVLYYNY
jgi:hypothetical protein